MKLQSRRSFGLACGGSATALIGSVLSLGRQNAAFAAATAELGGIKFAVIPAGTYRMGSPATEIGPGLIVHTPYGICIGPTRIGANCTVGTGVLIAGGSRGVGDNVYFGPGAKLIGDAKIGNNVVILANSTVITDVGDNLTIMGVPARIRLPGGKLRRFPRQPVQKS